MPPPSAPRAESLVARLKKFLGLGINAPAGAGAEGERRAGEFLRREHGFVIIARNWRNPRDRREEIDLVARDGEVLVFIEVKTRAAHALVSGYHAVNSGKKAILRRAIKAYLGGLAEKPRTFRFDIIEVALAAAGTSRSTSGAGSTSRSAEADDEIRAPVASAPEVRHFENVPLFPKHFQP